MFAGWTRALTIVAIAGTLAGCGAGSSNSNEQQSGEEISAEAIYKQRCVSCHAIDLQGRAGPNLQKVGAALTQEEIASIISDGKGGMPSFEKRLNEEQIEALAVWLASKQ